MSVLDKIVENLLCIVKSEETKKFVESSAENIASICLTGDLQSGILQESKDFVKYAGSIKDILFWEKMKEWLTGIYNDPQMEIKASSKFTEDNSKLYEYTKRQIQYIAEIDEIEKINYYANLTRSWLMGYIKTSVYFKLVYLLKVFTLEELDYLKKNYTENEIMEVNFYIREFSLYGLIDVIEETSEGNTTYKYSDLSKVFLYSGIDYGNYPIKFDHIGLEDMKITNTKACMEVIEF